MGKDKGKDTLNFEGTVIKKEKIRLEDEPVLIKPKETESAVRINLHREGEIIRVIEVICSCGNRINIACEYKNGKMSGS